MIETPENKKKRVKEIVEILKLDYPDAKTALNHSSALELLVATILSAQCTDIVVNEVTKELFKKYKTCEDYANANIEELEKMIYKTGFYKNKAKALVNCCKELILKFKGVVPSTIEDLTSLSGVGRKTANVLLGNFYKKPAIVVDTHVKRVSKRLGLTDKNDPDKIEFELKEIIDEEDQTLFSDCLIWHGRKVCDAKKPKCTVCSLAESCPKIGVINS